MSSPYNRTETCVSVFMYLFNNALQSKIAVCVFRLHSNYFLLSTRKIPEEIGNTINALQ